MNDTAVVNASPLIFLSRGGRASLLRHFYSRVLVPGQVAAEILARGTEDLTARLLSGTVWMEIDQVRGIPAAVEGWGLGPGESAVIALAMSRPGSEAVIDDLAGRRCAQALGVPVRGTLGLVLLAKRRGFIPAARPVVEELIRTGLYLSRHVMDQALARVGE